MNTRFNRIFALAVVCGFSAVFAVIVAVGAMTWTDATRRIVNLVANDFRVVDGTDNTGTSIKAIYHGQVTVANGDTTVSLTMTGVAATDRAFTTIVSGNPNGKHISTAVLSANSILITMDSDPGAATKVDVLVIRP